MDLRNRTHGEIHDDPRLSNLQYTDVASVPAVAIGRLARLDLLVLDLKGKRIGFTKGSSAHNGVIQTLEKAGLTYEDITPVYLTPPDAGPAFANGGIDAWAIWDPYFAIAQTRQNGRILVNSRDVTKTNAFYIANRDFARNRGAILQQIVDVTASTAKCAEAHPDDVATSPAAVTGVPLDMQPIAARQWSAGILPSRFQGVKLNSIGDPVLYIRNPTLYAPLII